ncbi:MAG: hypothetical protein EOP04_03820 [Proteobacteria bacterium]|nr:MAG: hypothetical protein EOP04_03820 [Pseudomonadota bacterium]
MKLAVKNLLDSSLKIQSMRLQHSGISHDQFDRMIALAFEAQPFVQNCKFLKDVIEQIIEDSEMDYRGSDLMDEWCEKVIAGVKFDDIALKNTIQSEDIFQVEMNYRFVTASQNDLEEDCTYDLFVRAHDDNGARGIAKEWASSALQLNDRRFALTPLAPMSVVSHVVKPLLAIEIKQVVPFKGPLWTLHMAYDVHLDGKSEVGSVNDDNHIKSFGANSVQQIVVQITASISIENYEIQTVDSESESLFLHWGGVTIRVFAECSTAEQEYNLAHSNLYLDLREALLLRKNDDLKSEDSKVDESYRAFAISTIHISEKDCQLLSDRAKDASLVTERECGYFVKLDRDNKGINYHLDMSDEYNHIIKYALDSGYSLVEIDRDASVYERFKAFDWQ